MKKNENQLTLTQLSKSIVSFFSSLFFTDSGKDFQRLKNFIAS